MGVLSFLLFFFLLIDGHALALLALFLMLLIVVRD